MVHDPFHPYPPGVPDHTTYRDLASKESDSTEEAS